MRKTDQEKMWEVFVESSNGGVISTGGALKAGGGSSAPKTSNDDEDAEDTDGDPYEDEEGKDELQDILTKCHSGDITAEEAHEHITKMVKGEGEDEENVRRGTVQKATDKMRGQFTKDKGADNVRRPAPDRSVQGVKRNTSAPQQGM
jgi:hypothetical protein